MWSRIHNYHSHYSLPHMILVVGEGNEEGPAVTPLLLELGLLIKFAANNLAINQHFFIFTTANKSQPWPAMLFCYVLSISFHVALIL